MLSTLVTVKMAVVTELMIAVNEGRNVHWQVMSVCVHIFLL